MISSSPKKRALYAFQLAGVRRHEEHIAAPQQSVRARHVQDDAAVHLAADGKGDACREVGLDQVR